MAFSPIVTPQTITAPAPIEAPFFTKVDGVRTDKDLVLDCYARRDESEGFDFAPVADGDPSLDLRVCSYLPILAYLASIQIGEVANDSTFTNITIIYRIILG